MRAGRLLALGMTASLCACSGKLDSHGSEPAEAGHAHSTGGTAAAAMDAGKEPNLDPGVAKDAGHSGDAGRAGTGGKSGSGGARAVGSGGSGGGGSAGQAAGAAFPDDTFLPWAGGPAYFAKWTHGLPSDADFFPIAVWLQ